MENKTKQRRWIRVAAMVCGGGLLPGFLGATCESISIEPSCPDQLRVGESGMVRANEINPGAIATYRWTVMPRELGRVQNANIKDTSFQALHEGDATLRLTASDGLFQVTADCVTRIRGTADLAVTLSSSPRESIVGRATTLTCLSVGSTEAVQRTITQIDGDIVELVDVEEGVVRFQPDVVGEHVFQCIGQSESGTRSAPAVLAILVLLMPTDNSNVNDNVAMIGNANVNENATISNVNVNDNSSSANENANVNDNTNTNDNRSGRPGSGRP